MKLEIHSERIVVKGHPLTLTCQLATMEEKKTLKRFPNHRYNDGTAEQETISELNSCAE